MDDMDDRIPDVIQVDYSTVLAKKNFRYAGDIWFKTTFVDGGGAYSVNLDTGALVQLLPTTAVEPLNVFFDLV